MGDDVLFARMRKWTAGNSLGWVFDNPVDTIDLQKASIIGFDYTDIIDNPEVRVPVINYLLHRLERSEEHTSELQSLMRISYAVFCLKKKNTRNNTTKSYDQQQTQTTHTYLSMTSN